MDLTYTDPLYIPVYSLDGIPNSLLEVRTFVNAIKNGREPPEIINYHTQSLRN